MGILSKRVRPKSCPETRLRLRVHNNKKRVSSHPAWICPSSPSLALWQQRGIVCVSWRIRKVPAAGAVQFKSPWGGTRPGDRGMQRWESSWLLLLGAIVYLFFYLAYFICKIRLSVRARRAKGSPAERRIWRGRWGTRLKQLCNWMQSPARNGTVHLQPAPLPLRRTELLAKEMT